MTFPSKHPQSGRNGRFGGRQVPNLAMIGGMTDAEVLDLLRAGFARVDGRLDHIDRGLDELVQRVGRLEAEVLSLHVEFAGISARLDRHETRLDRIERKLSLTVE